MARLNQRFNNGRIHGTAPQPPLAQTAPQFPNTPDSQDSPPVKYPPFTEPSQPTAVSLVQQNTTSNGRRVTRAQGKQIAGLIPTDGGKSKQYGPVGMSLEIGGRSELDGILKSTDVQRLDGATNLEEALSLAQDIIVNRMQVAEAVSTTFAFDIEYAWQEYFDNKFDSRDEKQKISRWRHEVESRVSRAKIKNFCDLAKKTRKEIESAEGKIQSVWKVPPNAILPPEYHPQKHSKALLQSLAKLSDQTTLDEARPLLENTILERQKTKATAAKPSDRHLKIRDVEQVLEGKGRKKRLHPESRYAYRHDRHPKRIRVASDQRAHDVAGQAGHSASISKTDERQQNYEVAPRNEHFELDSVMQEGELPADSHIKSSSQQRSAQQESGIPTPSRTASPGVAQDDGQSSEGESNDASIEIGRRQSPSGEKDLLDYPDSDILDLDLHTLDGASSPLSTRSPAMPLYTRSGKQLFRPGTPPAKHKKSLQATPLYPNKQRLTGGPGTVTSSRPLATLSSSPSQPDHPTDALIPSKAPTDPVLDKSLLGSTKPKTVHSGIASLQANTPDSELPVTTSDLAGALSTFRAGKLLSSTAIELVLKAFNVKEDTLLYDPQLFDIENPRRWSPKISKGVMRHILMPLHHAKANHWTLVEFNLQSKKIRHFDSLKGEFRQAERVALSLFAERVTNLVDWSFETGQCPSQDDEFNCGIHVLVTALFILTETTIPSSNSYDCRFWRSLFSCLLDPQSSPTPHDGSESLPRADTVLQPPVECDNSPTQEAAFGVAKAAKEEWETAAAALRARGAAHRELNAAVSALFRVHRARGPLLIQASSTLQAALRDRNTHVQIGNLAASLQDSGRRERYTTLYSQECEAIDSEVVKAEKQLTELQVWTSRLECAQKFALIQWGICAARVERTRALEGAARRRCQDLKRKMEESLSMLGNAFMDESSGDD